MQTRGSVVGLFGNSTLVSFMVNQKVFWRVGWPSQAQHKESSKKPMVFGRACKNIEPQSICFGSGKT